MTELVPARPADSAVVQAVPDLRLVALHPGQLEAEQKRLVGWAEAKRLEAYQHLCDLQENLDIATRNKWKVTTLRKAVAIQQKVVTYYLKLKTALDEGFYIIPNMAADVFAVRTAARKPNGKVSSTTSSWDRPSGQQAAKQLLAPGEGRYVSATETMQQRDEYTEQVKQGDKMVDRTTKQAWSIDFVEEIDFPFSLARPEVLNATQGAMLLKVFDEIAAVPPRRRNQDPMVIGRIYKPGTNDVHATFLIAWFLDTTVL